MQLYKTPLFVQWLYPSLVWRQSKAGKSIYLTFDDGPIPEVTPWVLQTLKHYGAKATFFCVGENVKRHPEIFKMLLADGHAIGNHTYHHLNGIKTGPALYLKDFLKCEEVLRENGVTTSLFRPPYGRISRRQVQMLASRYIVMWNVLSYDFSKKITAQKVLDKSIQHTTSGSIVVFHDSLKANENLKFALPKFLEHFQSQGYRFEAL